MQLAPLNKESLQAHNKKIKEAKPAVVVKKNLQEVEAEGTFVTNGEKDEESS